MGWHRTEGLRDRPRAPPSPITRRRLRRVHPDGDGNQSLG
jgi:hypothetical protein